MAREYRQAIRARMKSGKKLQGIARSLGRTHDGSYTALVMLPAHAPTPGLAVNAAMPWARPADRSMPLAEDLQRTPQQAAPT